MNKQIIRNFFYTFIVINIIAIWYFSYTNNSYFSIEKIQEFLDGQNLYIALLMYIVILTIRWLTLLPWTPLLVLGAILFPLLYAFIAVQIAVQLYILVIYRYSNILDFEIPKKVLDYKSKIQKYWIAYIILLCVIPWMSMNILAYFLSTLKIPLKTQMIWIGIGSTINLFLYLSIFKTLFSISS